MNFLFWKCLFEFPVIAIHALEYSWRYQANRKAIERRIPAIIICCPTEYIHISIFGNLFSFKCTVGARILHSLWMNGRWAASPTISLLVFLKFNFQEKKKTIENHIVWIWIRLVDRQKGNFISIRPIRFMNILRINSIGWQQDFKGGNIEFAGYMGSMILTADLPQTTVIRPLLVEFNRPYLFLHI